MNVSTEGIDESLHGLGEIEEFPSKNGVFSRIEKLRSESARESEGISTRLEVLGSLQGVTKTTRTNSTTRAQESKTKIEFQSNNARKRKELRQDQNPGGHKEGRASFPDLSTYKVSRIHGSNPREERWSRETGRRRWRQAQGSGSVLFWQGAGREERGEGVFKVPTQGSKILSTQTRH